MDMPKPRGRELGLPFPGETGRHNAITDVPGLEVGFTTRIEGEGPLIEGKGPVRTGVTAILPLGRQSGARAGLGRHVRAQRQRRDDRHPLDPRRRLSGRAGLHHQHP